MARQAEVVIVPPRILKVDHEGKELPQLEAVEPGLRPLAKLAVVDDAPLAAVSNQP